MRLKSRAELRRPTIGLVLVLGLTAFAQPSLGQKRSGPAAAAPPAQPLNLPGEVNDERMENLLDEAAGRLMDTGRTVKMSELLLQLGRRSCSVSMPKLGVNKLPAAELAARNRAGVLMWATFTNARNARAGTSGFQAVSC